MKIVLLDNEGAFTHSIKSLLVQTGADVAILGRNSSREDLLAHEAEGVIITPGIGSAAHAGDIGLTSQLVRHPMNVPVLGLGLGMLGLMHFSGCNLRPLQDFLHGSQVDVTLQPHPLFEDIPDRISAGCYMTTTVDPLGMSDGWRSIAKTDGHLIVGVAHDEHPWYGLQFQPASVLTPDGVKILENFLNLAAEGKA